LLFNFSNNFLFVELSNSEILIFLQVIRVSSIFVDGGFMANAKVYQGLKVEEHCNICTNMKKTEVHSQVLDIATVNHSR